MQRYAITGRLIPLSESGVPQIGLAGAVNIHEASHDVYTADDVQALVSRLEERTKAFDVATQRLGEEQLARESAERRLDSIKKKCEAGSAVVVPTSYPYGEGYREACEHILEMIVEKPLSKCPNCGAEAVGYVDDFPGVLTCMNCAHHPERQEKNS